MKLPDPRALLALLVSSGIAACGGGGGGGGSGSSADASTVNLLVADAPSDDLSAFEVTITGLFLSTGGVEGANLLPFARTVNLIDLATRSAWMEVAAVAPGSYDGARLAFDPTSLVARDLGGALHPVTATSSSAIATLAPPLVLARGQNRKVHFELPLASTVTDDLANPGALIWTPLLVVGERRGADEPLDELHGRVLSDDPIARSLRVELVDRDGGVAHGDFTLALQPGAVLLDDNGNPFATESAFFAFTSAGDRVEADGALADDGRFFATLVHVERDAGGGAADVARIRGSITALDTAADRLTLRIRTIDFGRSVVEPVLAGLGDPSEIEVDWLGAEFKIRGDDPRSGSELDLAIGQTVKVDFRTFTTSPFRAHEIEVEDEAAEFEGTITDTAALPSSFVVHLEPHDPAILAGLVASASTDVVVLLDGSESCFLKLDGEPSIAAGALLAHLRVRVRGDLSGSPSAPQIAASSVRVNPGRLRGTVTSANASTGLFTVDVSKFDDPFGGSSLPDPLTLRMQADATVTGDAQTTTEFFALFGGLGAGESLAVEVFGLADGLGGAGAFEVEAKVKG